MDIPLGAVHLILLITLRTKIQEGVINFHMYHFWDTDIEGRHINYMGRPYTLHQYMHGQCCVMAFPGWRTIEEILRVMTHLHPERISGSSHLHL